MSCDDMDERMFGLEWWPALSCAHSCERGNPVSCFFWVPASAGTSGNESPHELHHSRGHQLLRGLRFPSLYSEGAERRQALGELRGALHTEIARLMNSIERTK